MRPARALLALLPLIASACGGAVSPAPDSRPRQEEGALPPPKPGAPLGPTDVPAPEPSATPAPTGTPAPARSVTFAADVAPVLARCQPCHFPGGKVYDRLPFDRPETVRTLGTKLFTRIKDPDHQQVIRDFLAQAH